jgi:hypothetical protein
MRIINRVNNEQDWLPRDKARHVFDIRGLRCSTHGLTWDKWVEFLTHQLLLFSKRRAVKFEPRPWSQFKHGRHFWLSGTMWRRNQMVNTKVWYFCWNAELAWKLSASKTQKFGLGVSSDLVTLCDLMSPNKKANVNLHQLVVHLKQSLREWSLQPLVSWVVRTVN